MNEFLRRWNLLPHAEAVASLLSCCGSLSWAERLASQRPFSDGTALAVAADEVWRSLPSADWLAAFRSHPRIGESSAETPSGARSAQWSRQEQQDFAAGRPDAKTAFAEANLAYEHKFGYIFIVCATGKSAAEMMEILRRRMHNDPDTELLAAAEQQRQIMQLRLKKWLQT